LDVRIHPRRLVTWLATVYGGFATLALHTYLSGGLVATAVITTFAVASLPPAVKCSAGICLLEGSGPGCRYCYTALALLLVALIYASAFYLSRHPGGGLP